MRTLLWCLLLFSLGSWARAQPEVDDTSPEILEARLSELRSGSPDTEGALQHATNALAAAEASEGEPRARALAIAAAAIAVGEQREFHQQVVTQIAQSARTLDRAEIDLSVAEQRLQIAQRLVADAETSREEAP